jgi:uncharacterized protein
MDAVTRDVGGVQVPFASPRLLWRMKTVTRRAKAAGDIVFLRPLVQRTSRAAARRVASTRGCGGGLAPSGPCHLRSPAVRARRPPTRAAPATTKFCIPRPCYTPAVTAVDALRHALAAESSVVLAVLFGSIARGTSAPASDLDLGVMGVSSSRLPDVELALSRAVGRDVDLVALETAPPLLRFEIARDGIVVLERAPHAWADFRARAMVDWWDWAPLARRFQRAAANRLGVVRGPA